MGFPNAFSDLWRPVDVTPSVPHPSACLQTPAEVITDTLTDVLRVGGGALVAGAMLPAQGIRMVFEKIQVLNKAGGFGGGAAGTQPSPGPN